MTNHIKDLKEQILKHNRSYKTDFSIVKVLDDEVMFVELETSSSDKQIFEFAIQYGRNNFKRNIEGRL